MLITPISLLAFTTAGLSGILAFYMWRKAAANYTLLVESATSFDSVRKDFERISESARGQNDEMKRLRDGALIARNDADAARQNLAGVQERMLVLETSSHTSREQRAHERQQFITQLESANAQIAGLSARTAQAQQVADATLNTELQASQERTAALAQNLVRTAADLTTAQGILREQQELMHRIKRRNAHLERLYQSMRSLKIMAEERSTNWEFALKDLSTWTLTQQNSLPATSRQSIKDLPIGELVGGALEAIGKSLIEVEHENENEHEQ